MATYGYARVSTTAQVDQGLSLQAQEQKIYGRALMDAWTVDRIFVERGVSGGRPLAERPEGSKLLAMVKPGDRVICAKLDRMFRNSADALATLQVFKQRAVALHLLDMGGDDCTTNGISSLVFTILSAVAEFERGRIAERIAEGKLQARGKQRFGGGSRPFGWRVEDGLLVEAPDEQRAIRKAREMRAAGASLRQIELALADDGFDVSRPTINKLTGGAGDEPAAAA